MSSLSTVNYRDNLFEYPELTKIHGEPTYESLKILQNELKTNSQTVHTVLGGANHGYLGIVLSPAQYAMISPVAFEEPEHPGPLVIPANVTQQRLATLQSLHAKAVRLFREYTGFKKALIQQIVKALDPQYLAALRNRQTNAITANVNQILQFLFQAYGKVSPQLLHAEEENVKAHIYNPNHPIDIIFNLVEDLVDFSDAADIPYTQEQSIGIAYVILNKAGRMRTDIRDWNRRPQNEKTWIVFKEHFRRAHDELRETTDLTLADAAQQQANLVQQVIEGVQQVLENPHVATPVAEANDNVPPEEEPLFCQQVNSVSQNADVVPQILQQMQQMQNMMFRMQSNMPPFGMYNGNRANRQNNRFVGQNQASNRRGNRNSGPPAHQHSKYCWTHGACAHESHE
jgi:hypothetical protein